MTTPRSLAGAVGAALLWCSLCWAPTYAQDGGWKILTIEVPPIAFTGPQGKPTGYCVEVVQEIQRRIGNTLPIEVYPWARAYDMGLQQQPVVLVCPKRTPEREDRFQWVGPLLVSEANLYARQGTGIRISSLEEAKAAPGILVGRATFTYEHLKGAGFTNLDVTNASANTIKMLMAGRQPLMAMDQQELSAQLAAVQMDKQALELVYPLTPTRSFLTFPKNAPDAMVQTWQKALNQMRKDGTLKVLYRHWFE